MYQKRHDGHDKTHWATDFCNSVLWLEVNKCTFTFTSEIRPIQCMRTEFWCVQCPRPAGPSALDKHHIQASALDLSYFMSKSKCKFINLIYKWQKNKIICSRSWKIINKMVFKMPLNMKNINNFTQWKKWISRCDVCARDHAPKAPRAHCKYQRYILTRCSVNLLVVFNTMVLKRVFFVIINTCVALIWALMC